MDRKRLLVAVGLALLAGAGDLPWRPGPSSLPPAAWAAEHDLTARPPERIVPGTVVGRTAPEGWSHLVIKSLPRVRPADRAGLWDKTVTMASWMFTAFTADVRPETRDGRTAHQLRRVGLGLGTSIGGRDVVITPDTAEKFGAYPDFITRQIAGEILEKGYKTMDLAVVPVHGPTFAVVDTPVWFWCQGKNTLVRFRYGLLVDAASGRLDVVSWIVDPPAGCPEADVFALLAPDTIDEVELVPDPTRFTAGLTACDDAFGVDRLPRNRLRVPAAPELRDLAAKAKFTADEARDLEAGLRRLIAGK